MKRKKKDSIPVVGSIVLEEEEKEALMLHPKTRIYSDIRKDDFVTEQEICMAKISWEKKKLIEHDEEDFQRHGSSQW